MAVRCLLTRAATRKEVRMAELETVYADRTSWIYFKGEDESETVGVYCRCYCGRYLKMGRLFMNKAGEIKLKGFTCKVCGEVEPYFDRNIQEYNKH